MLTVTAGQSASNRKDRKGQEAGGGEGPEPMEFGEGQVPQGSRISRSPRVSKGLSQQKFGSLGSFQWALGCGVASSPQAPGLRAT